MRAKRPGKIGFCAVAFLTLGLPVLDFAGSAFAGSGHAQETTGREFKPRVVLRKHLPPIVDAPVIAGADVTDQVLGNELVIGVLVGGQPRAYPINMLTGPSREIINDELAGRAIAATW